MSLSPFVDKGAQTIQVEQVVIHPEFVPATLLNDICLLKLKTPIEMNSKKVKKIGKILACYFSARSASLSSRKGLPH